jgi:two-component system, NtrC family, sensor kinase
MLTRFLAVIFVIAGGLPHVPVYCAGTAGFDLADTVRINHNIQLSQRLYQEFKYDSSLFYAAHALELSGHLLHIDGVESDEHLFTRMKSLKAQSYVMYAYSLIGFDLQAAEDSLLAGLNLIGENGSATEKAAIFSGLGIIYERKGQNDQALQYFKISSELYQKSGDQINYLAQLIYIGITLRSMGKYGESLEYLMEALKIGRQVNNSDAIVEALLAMGFIYAFVERWEDALKYQQQALAIYQQTNNLLGVARIHNDMGVTYMSVGKLDSALTQHRAALAIRLETDDSYNTFASYLYIGDILAEQENFSEAIEYYEKGLPYGIQSGYKITVVDANLQLGNYYLELSDIESAREKYKIALQMSRELGDPTGQSRAAMGLVKISLDNNENEDAISMLKTVENTAPESRIHFRKDIYKEIAEAYFTLGDYRSAYLNNLVFSEVKDSVNAAENLEKITRLSNVLEFENEIALKKESNEKMIAIKEAQINRERITRNIFLSGMILAVVLVVIIFIRFVEKKKLNTKLNEILSNLRETQTQLIHAEKMASLGELTAGIAHEIQNPLNFVINFSGIGSEMVMEIEEERAKDSGSRDEELVGEILTEIKQNLEKIHHHGKRADAIVKGMLQHSRTNTGQMEPTYINALADEYLRLSYHGLRAKDKSFNASFETDFDPNLPKVKVVAQDIGRVLLNLINNAFYACAERSRSAVDEKTQTGFRPAHAGLSGLDDGKDYKPTVIVSTKNLGDKIEISVNDNGLGIPEEIKNKIFQPFFTTKPSGQGTGLGLSLSYDIVKMHGGELRVESKKGEGSNFIIVLPTQSL